MVIAVPADETRLPGILNISLPEPAQRLTFAGERPAHPQFTASRNLKTVLQRTLTRTAAAAVPLTLFWVSGVTPAATTIDFILKQQGMADVAQAAYIDNGRILIKAAGGDANMDLLFDQASQTMTIINHAEKSLLDLDAERAVSR